MDYIYIAESPVVLPFSLSLSLSLQIVPNFRFRDYEDFGNSKVTGCAESQAHLGHS